jgi:hypothetical protein
MHMCVHYNLNCSSLPDFFTTSWSPSHSDPCQFKATILAPLQWARQTLSSFGFPTSPNSSCMRATYSVQMFVFKFYVAKESLKAFSISTAVRLKGSCHQSERQTYAIV